MSLPSGWARAKFADIAIQHAGNGQLIKGRLQSQSASGLFPAFSASGQDVWRETFDHEGDAIIVSAVGARCGKAFRATGRWSAIANTHVVRPEPTAVDVDYLYLTLNDEEFWEKGGTAQPFVKVRATLERNISVPPLAEQRRIVAKLDALRSRLIRAGKELDRTPALTHRLREQVLYDAYIVAGNNAGFEPIRYFIASLDQGWSPKCENYPSKSPEEWAVLKTTAIQALQFREHENKVLPSTMKPREQLEVAAGDVLVTRAGPRVRVGISCTVAETRPRLILADKIYRLRCNPRLSDPDYLAFMLNTPQILQRIESMKTGISDSGLNLTQDKFLTLPIPKLNLDQQRGLVRQLAGHLARADRLGAEVARARALLDRLQSATLAKALRGELVPQDPDDEPATALLERIWAERQGAPKAKRGRRARATADA